MSVLRARQTARVDAARRRTAAEVAAAQRASEAYASWVAIDTLDKAIASVDDQVVEVSELAAEMGETVGQCYRRVADAQVTGRARLSGTGEGSAPWWDARCDAAARLLWQAANGRAKAYGA